MDAEREQKIRWAIEDVVSLLVDRQAAGDGSGDRGWSRTLAGLQERGARLLQPPPQVFDALELPAEFSQSVVVPVPVPSTVGELVVHARATVRELGPYEAWSGSVLRVEPPGDGLEALRERTDALLAAARVTRGEQSRAVPPLPVAPVPRSALLRLGWGDPAASRSRFGGVPFLPPGTDWPLRESGRPLHFLAQVDLREVACDLPADGTLAFFYDADHDAWESPDEAAVLFAPAGAELQPLVAPAETRDDFVRPVAGMRFVDDDREEPMHRLLGEPDAIQSDPLPGPDWRLLLQLDSGEPLDFEFGDSGRIYFVMRGEDLAAGRWDPPRVVFQCY